MFGCGLIMQTFNLQAERRSRVSESRWNMDKRSRRAGKWKGRNRSEIVFSAGRRRFDSLGLAVFLGDEFSARRNWAFHLFTEETCWLFAASRGNLNPRSCFFLSFTLRRLKNQSQGQFSSSLINPASGQFVDCRIAIDWRSAPGVQTFVCERPIDGGLRQINGSKKKQAHLGLR